MDNNLSLLQDTIIKLETHLINLIDFLMLNALEKSRRYANTNNIVLIGSKNMDKYLKLDKIDKSLKSFKYDILVLNSDVSSEDVADELCKELNNYTGRYIYKHRLVLYNILKKINLINDDDNNELKNYYLNNEEDIFYKDDNNTFIYIKLKLSNNEINLHISNIYTKDTFTYFNNFNINLTLEIDMVNYLDLPIYLFFIIKNINETNDNILKDRLNLFKNIKNYNVNICDLLIDNNIKRFDELLNNNANRFDEYIFTKEQNDIIEQVNKIIDELNKSVKEVCNKFKTDNKCDFTLLSNEKFKSNENLNNTTKYINTKYNNILKEYTETGYKGINSYIFNTFLNTSEYINDEFIEDYENMRNAFNNIKHSDTPNDEYFYVYRFCNNMMICNDRDFNLDLDILKANDTIYNPPYLSTTYEPTVFYNSLKFITKNTYIYKIKLYYNKNNWISVESVSTYKDENEIIINKGSTLKIININKCTLSRQREYMNDYLQEVPIIECEIIDDIYNTNNKYVSNSSKLQKGGTTSIHYNTDTNNNNWVIDLVSHEEYKLKPDEKNLPKRPSEKLRLGCNLVLNNKPAAATAAATAATAANKYYKKKYLKYKTKYLNLKIQ